MHVWIIHRLKVAIVTTTLLWTATGFAQPRPPATQESAPSDDVPALMSAGQYAEALRVINRVLPPERGGIGVLDRQALLMMRVECQLHLKLRDAAVITLGTIATEAERSSDVLGQSEAITLSTLVQRSSNLMYVPKTITDKTPLNILDPVARKTAYRALLADEMAAARAQQASAKTSASLTPLFDIARNFSRLQAIDRTASGDAKQSDNFGNEVMQWATKLIEQNLSDCDARITKIAADVGRGSGSRRSNTVRSGLDQSQTAELENIVADCGKIPATVEELNKSFGRVAILSTATHARAVAERANTVLEGGIASPAPKSTKRGN